MTRPLRVGSLCTGIGGLELGLRLAGLDTLPVFVSDIDPGANTWLAANMPDTPNLGDFTALDELPDVDIITAGFPCQPFSTAGKRAGLTDERYLFDDIARLTSRMETRPYLFLENVPGLLTANNGHAMARVVHSLAAIGYHITWGTLAASDVGAPHRRLRWWGLALDTNSVVRPPAWQLQHRARRNSEPGSRTDTEPVRAIADTVGTGQKQSRTSSNETGRGCIAGRDRSAAADADSNPSRRDSRTVLSSEEQERRQQHEGDRPWHSGDAAAADADSASSETRQHTRSRSKRTRPQPVKYPAHDFGPYKAAVERWEQLTGEQAPAPTDNERLSPAFVEWMMGYPPGHVTDTLTNRRQALHALGNAVVPQCAAAAFQQLTTRLCA